MNPLRELRRSLGWSQERTAQEVGKSVSAVRLYERGAYKLPHEVAAKLANAARAAGFYGLAEEVLEFSGKAVAPEQRDIDNQQKPEEDVERLLKRFQGVTGDEADFLFEMLQFFKKASGESLHLIRGLARTLIRLETQGRRGRK